MAGKLITDSIELTKLKSAITTTAKGTKCIMIPIEQNGIKITDKGQVFLNFNTWHNDVADQYGNEFSHSLQLSKEEIANGVKATYIGNGKYHQRREDSPTPPNDGPDPIGEEDFDLPF